VEETPESLSARIKREEQKQLEDLGGGRAKCRVCGSCAFHDNALKHLRAMHPEVVFSGVYKDIILRADAKTNDPPEAFATIAAVSGVAISKLFARRLAPVWSRVGVTSLPSASTVGRRLHRHRGRVGSRGEACRRSKIPNHI
jgi:hypothetical protein